MNRRGRELVTWTVVCLICICCNGAIQDNETDGGVWVDAAAQDQSPIASFTMVVESQSVTVDAGESHDPDGASLAYEWDYGDGSAATGVAPQPRYYADGGDYAVTLTVTDADGLTDSTTQIVTITAGPSTTGAELPIMYNLGDLGGTIYFVAADGDDGDSGTQSQPIQTIAEAVSRVGSRASATVVVRGGVYSEGGIQVPVGRQVRIIAYPGEVPSFRGSQPLIGTWNVEGGLRWHAYVPQPVVDGSGVSFSTGQNLNGDGVGKFADQAWSGTQELRQVSAKVEVASGTFFVDSNNDRLYLTAADATQPDLHASSERRFIRILGAGSSIEGVRIVRYSNNPSNYGVVLVEEPAHNVVFRDVEIVDAAFQSIVLVGRVTNILQAPTLERITIHSSNWVGMTAVYVDDLVLDHVRIIGTNSFEEFSLSPVSGGLKTSRCRHIRVLDSVISNNKSHALWFDQSNVDVDVAGNQLHHNFGAGVFFEISDDLLMINNYVLKLGNATPAVKLAGSSGLKLVNNTIVGGADAIGIYTDGRSILGCSTPGQPPCGPFSSSDRDEARPIPVTLDWMPRLDLMLNNVVGYPTLAGLCGSTTALCLLSNNASATQPIEEIVHLEDSARGIPQTKIDGNLYVGDSGLRIVTENGSYASHTTWSSAAAQAPISIAGIDANSLSDNAFVDADGVVASVGTHQLAPSIPVDAELNAYVAAGTRHFGVLP